jgi:hypothetical protein
MPHRLNRITGIALIVLSLIALSPLVFAYLVPQPPQDDEGTLAHIFQIAVVLQLPVLVVFLATADWDHPLRSLRPTAVQFAVMAVAFTALYQFEHP